MNKEPELKRSIGLGAAISTVMGTVIGAGVFFKAASVATNTHSVLLSVLAWIVGGLLTICGGLTVSELASALPKTGGPTYYLKYTYGEQISFLFGWAETIIYIPANIAALAIIFATQLINLFHLSNSIAIPIAILSAFTIVLINLMGAKFAGRVQYAFLIFKLIPIIVIVVAGLVLPGHVDISLAPQSASASSNVFAAFGGGLLATMFAYDGWINVSTIAGEMKNPKRDLPLAIVIGLALIMVIYVTINWIFMKNLPIDQIAGNQNTAFEVSTRLFGAFGGKLVTIGILISVYGAMNGYLLTGARIPYALGKSDQIPFSKAFSKLTKNTRIPWVSCFFMFAIAIIMIFLGSFDLLTDMLVFVIWIFNILLFIAVFILRKREPKLDRPYKVPGYPVIPIVAMIGGAYILIATLINQTGLALTGIGLTLLGIPVYYGHRVWEKKHSK